MSDPRVRRRVKTVVHWLLPYLEGRPQGDDEVPLIGPFEWSAKRLREVFGNTSNNDLSRWLMANVLQQTGFYRVGEFPYSYYILPNGLEKMLRLLSGSDLPKSAKNVDHGSSHN